MKLRRRLDRIARLVADRHAQSTPLPDQAEPRVCYTELYFAGQLAEIPRALLDQLDHYSALYDELAKGHS